MEFDKAFFDEEVRSGYLVTEKMKKVWACELEILAVFDGICKKHDLKWYADYGTLLGAVRHQGFIPWDDDIDVCMFRDDYQKLKSVVVEELSEPFYFRDSYTDSAMIQMLSKVENINTSAIEWPSLLGTDFHQGIFIDIFPLDDVPDDTHLDEIVANMELAMWYGIIDEEMFFQEPGFSRLKEILGEYLSLPYVERFRALEEFCLSHCGISDMVHWLPRYFVGKSTGRKRSCYDEIIYLPFENIKLPCPAGYDEILTLDYGNYMEPVQGGSAHEGIFLDPDRSYTTYTKEDICGK